MINIGDFYSVLTAMVPLYVAMFVAYGSVRWGKIFTPVQCSGINRFVAVFAVPLLSFHFISNNNPYKMDGPFILADTISKIAIFLTLMVWARFSRSGGLDWLITLFSLATLPNTLVMGIPLLEAMYGQFYSGLMVQVVVLQCIIWYTLLLFLFEYRGAAILVREQFPDTAASIISFKVDSDVVSLDGREPLQTVADICEDGKLRVTIRRSISSRSQAFSSFNSPRRSMGLPSVSSSKAITPRASNLTGVDIYSLQTGRNLNPVSPRQSNFTMVDSLQSSRGPTPRASNVNEDNYREINAAARGFNSPRLPQHFGSYSLNMTTQGAHNLATPGWNGYPGISPKCLHTPKRLPDLRTCPKMEDEGKDLHMFVWSSTASPLSETGLNAYSGDNKHSHEHKEARVLVVSPVDQTPNAAENSGSPLPYPVQFAGKPSTMDASKGTPKDMPPAIVMLKLILKMVVRKLLRNPNTYSSVLGLTWSLIAFRWNISLPTIVTGSIKILSDAGLGMAMFSLGLFMALQPRLIACGAPLAAFAMAVRFLTGPAVMAASSIAVGLRKVDLHAAIVQAALPQGIVPFVFSREYDLHPDILSTAVIFGMLIALPITLVYYILLGL